MQAIPTPTNDELSKLGQGVFCMGLTFTKRFGQDARTWTHSKSGVQTRSQGGNSRQQRGYFYFRQHLQPSLGGGVGGVRPCRFLDPVCNLHRRPPMRANMRGRFNQPSRSLAMSINTPIDRKTASRLNPLISELFTEDTLDQCARLVRDLGFFISLAECPEGNAEPRFGSLYLITQPIAAALFYESENAYLAAARKSQGESHV
jgi:hypothetical protein